MRKTASRIAGLSALALSGALLSSARADETCMSPFLPKITGQEDFVYVWTLGIEGLGDGSDKLVTVDANPKSKTYGKVIASTSLGGRHEAHHGGFTDDRRHLWLGGLDDSMIYIFDVAADPANPKLVKTIDSFVEDSGGVVGPHGFYALPGVVLISALSNAKDRGGKTALVEYSNEGKYIRTIWMPEKAPYGYDARVEPRLNRMLTSSFTGADNYMRDFASLVADAEAMKRFGNSMVLWDFHARRPIQVFEVPGAPLEIRWALQPRHHYAFTATALTARLWLIEQQEDGTFRASDIGPVGDPSQTPLPVDISISADDRFLFVDTFMDGTCRVYDISDPHHPEVIHQKKIGAQVNMVSQSWDGERIYFTSSLLANWDKKGAENEQFLKAYAWDGKELKPLFAIDFLAEKIGRPHIMRFGQRQFYENQIYAENAAAVRLAAGR
jgi:selenium-binding protein 1